MGLKNSGTALSLIFKRAVTPLIVRFPDYHQIMMNTSFEVCPTYQHVLKRSA